MTRARKTLVDPETTSYYHCIGRCVRRAWLWGEDRVSGRNYEHRKSWVTARLAELADVFTIDVCAYAVMSNHYHLVLRLDTEKARALGEDEVIARYGRLFKMPVLIERYLDGLTTDAESAVAQTILGQWRERLCDLSWYMRGLNEHLARRANLEDGCKGRFWEGRYKSQALLDNAAVLTCMSYVDLNPIRAKMAEMPEDSDFTSIQQRIRSFQSEAVAVSKDAELPVLSETSRAQPPLMPLVKASEDEHVHALGYTERDYVELVDWAGRAVRADKRGAIPRHIPPVLNRLGLDPGRFLHHMTGKSKLTQHLTAIGPLDKLQALAKKMGQSFLKGNGLARQLYCASV